MNQTLQALSSKLSYQLNELNQAIRLITEKITRLEMQFQLGQQIILDANQALTTHLIPEQEMARLHYILSAQQHQDNLHTQQHTLLAERDLLEKKRQRLHIECKQFERYMQAQQNKIQQFKAKIQQHQADEWALTNGVQ